MSKEKGSSLIGLRRSFEALELLSRHKEGLSFSRLQSELDNLPAPTLSRLLKVMDDENWVAKNSDGTYAPGSQFINVSRRISSGATLEDLISPVVTDLAETAAETAAFTIFVDKNFVFKAKCEQPDSYHHIELNRKSSAIFTNGYGMANLAFQDKETINSCLEDIPDSIDPKEFSDKLAMIKEEEFLFSDERLGIRFLKPVFYGEDGKFAGTMGLSCIVRKTTKKEFEIYKSLVTKAAIKASKALSAIKQ